MRIPFNKPFLVGKELDYIRDAVESCKISGNGVFTKKCQRFFEQRYGFPKTLLTTSCTDALEMSAILTDIGPGDEVILPSYTFVSTANAFVLRGAKIVFADSQPDHPNLDPAGIEACITDKTKAIVLIHYAGIACDMDPIMALAAKHDLYVIEDAAQAIDAYYKKRALGSIGHLATFSFHETKNVISGEGGLLVLNEERFAQRAEIIWEKGTNRSAFFRGEVDKYGWVDIGSSFLPSDILAAFLYAQLEQLDQIQAKRVALWNCYNEGLQGLPEMGVGLPQVPNFASNNAHIFYLLTRSEEERDALIAHLKAQDVQAVFHYLSLHKSPYYKDKHDGRPLPNADRFSSCLLRLPLFYELEIEQADRIAQLIRDFYASHKSGS